MLYMIRANQRAVSKLREAQKLKETDPDSFLRKFVLAEFPEWALECAELPPLESEGAWEKWFDVGWMAVIDATGGHPEKDARLAPIGAYRKDHSVRTHSQRELTEKTGKSNIKDGIRQALRAAFSRIAGSPKISTRIVGK
jgi:hypothetical protein